MGKKPDVLSVTVGKPVERRDNFGTGKKNRHVPRLVPSKNMALSSHLRSFINVPARPMQIIA
jgi:hypothetical protein